VAPLVVGEGNGAFAVSVHGAGGNASVDLPVLAAPGGATAPADFEVQTATVTVAPDTTTVVVGTVVDDAIDEDDETFSVSVGGAMGVVTIVDDDLPPVAVIDGLTITEGDDGTIDADLQVRLVDPFVGLLPQPSGKVVTVIASTLDGTAFAGDDYLAQSTPIAFAPGVDTRTFTVPIVGDDVDEPTETFRAVLGALSNVTVAANEDATITVVDDDGSSTSTAAAIEAGGAAAASALPQWAGAFDLDGFGPGTFELPVVTDDLAQLFGLTDAVDGVANPFDGLPDDLGALADQLEAAGVTIDWIEGGLGGRPLPPAGTDVIQARYQTSVADLFGVTDFAGDGFNDDMTSVLEGLAAAHGLDADLISAADLSVTLVVGVDENGFYVADDTTLTLALEASASVAGTATFGGVPGRTVVGTGAADLDVSLVASGGPARLRAADLGASAYTVLEPAATGTAALELDTQVGALDTTWSSAYVVTTDAGGTTVATEATLGATLALPELVVDLAGTFDGVAWHVHGEADAGTTIDGFDVVNLVADTTITPATFTGALTADVLVNAGTGPSLSVGIHAALDDSMLDAVAHVELDDVTFGSPPSTITLTGVTLDLTFALDLDTGDGTITAALHADGLAGSVAGAIEFAVGDVDLVLDPNATGPVFTIAELTATMPALGGLGVTITGFRMHRDGTFGATSASALPGSFAAELGIAGILPFDLHEIDVEFPNPSDLSTFVASVSGAFDLVAMEVFPFDPLITIDGNDVTAGETFSFSVVAGSLGAGGVAPLDFGPISLGIANLDIGGLTLGGTLDLGRYEDGEWIDDFGGELALDGDIEVIDGDASVAVGLDGLDVDAGTLDLDASFAISARLGDAIEIEGASLDVALGIAFGDGLTVTGPTLTGTGIDRLLIPFGDVLRLAANDVALDFTPAPGAPLVTFGELEVTFDESAGMLADWGGSAGNLAIDPDFTPRLLPGFFVDIDPPADERFGLPDFLPLVVDEVGIRFPNVDVDALPPGGLTLDDLSNFVLRLSGGLAATDTWPIAASVDGLEVDLGKLVRGEFPITNLDGFLMGVEPFELVPGFVVGGGLGLGTVDVDADPGAGESIEDVFYGRVFGTFEYEGMGAGIDLVVSQYGPVLAQVQAPLGIPLDGGLLGGVVLAGVQGGVKFGGSAFPDPERPLEILHEPEFDTDFPITTETIRSSVESAVQDEELTWDNGFTLALSGTLTHALAPGVVTGDVTIGANIGLGGGPPRLKLIGKGDLSVYGMPFAGAALLIDLAQPAEPKFDFAFETPQVGNPLSFLLPAQATFEVSLDTTGILPGFAIGTRTFVERVAAGTLDVAQEFFSAALDEVAHALAQDHQRPLARLVLDGLPPDTVITSELIVARVLAALGVGGDGMPLDAFGAGAVAQAFVFELLDAAARIVDEHDLGAVGDDPDLAVFVDVLGAGGEAVAALLGVLREGALAAGQAFIDQLDPAFVMRGAIQPVILGIPFGEPEHEVELVITKDGLGFGFDTSLHEISERIADAIVPFIGSALLNVMSLGFEDQLGLTVQLPIGGIVDGLFGGSGVPTIDPFSGDWAIELRGGLEFLDMEIGQMTGLVIAAGNQGFLDAHVQKLFDAPDAPLDADRIPIQDPAHYAALLEHGGVLLNGRLLAPELLTDPIGLLSELDQQPPDDPFALPDWVAAIADHLTRVDQPANVQIFVPGFASVLDFDFDAATETDRVTPRGSGQTLADDVNELFAAAYLEGTFEGTLLSLPLGRGRVDAQDGKVAVTSEIPLIGAEGTFLLDTNPVETPMGPVPLPRAASVVTIDDERVDELLADFGVPSIFAGLGNADATFRAFSPAYDLASPDPLHQFGGIAIDAQLDFLSIVQDANFRLGLSLNGDVHARADVGTFTPFPGVTLADGVVGFTKIGPDFAGEIGGTVTLPGWLAAATGVSTAAVDGAFDSSGNMSLAVTVNGVTYDLVAIFGATVDQIVDILVDLGKDFATVVNILFTQVTTSATVIVDQLARLGADFLQIAEALVLGMGAGAVIVSDQLVRLGADFIELADALFQKVTRNIRGIADQLVRTGASYIQLAEALLAKVTSDIAVIVDNIVRKGADHIELAEAMLAELTTDIAVIADQVFRKFANLPKLAEALLLEVTNDIGRIADELVRKGADHLKLAGALFEKVTTDVVEIVDQVFRKFPDFVKLAAAIKQKVVNDVTAIVDQLVRKGASFVQLADALVQSVTTNIATIADQIVRVGADHLQLAEALFSKFSGQVNAVVDQVFRKFSDFVLLAEAIKSKIANDIVVIVDQVRRKGASYIQLADALVQKVTTNVVAIVDQLVRKSANHLEIAEALFLEVTQSLQVLVEQLRRVGTGIVNIALALEQKTPALVFDIINAIDDFTNATIDELIDALEAMGMTALAAIIDTLEALGYGNFADIAAALDRATGWTDGVILDAIDDATNALLGDLVDAIEAMGTTGLNAIINMLEAIGYSDFVAMAQALNERTEALVAEIINAIDDATAASLDNLIDALEIMGTTALGPIIDALEALGYRSVASIVAIAAALDRATGWADDVILAAIDDFTGVGLATLVDAVEAMGTSALTGIINMLEAIGYADFPAIAAALDAATGFTDGEILNALDDATTAALDELVDAIEAMGTSALGTIIDMLEAIGYTDVIDLAEALDDATAATYRQIVGALDDFTSASFNAIAEAVRDAGASFATIVAALDAETTAGVSAIADAIRFAGASFTQVMQALEDELDVTRYDTAAQIRRLGASIDTVISALIDVYNATITSIVDVLVDAIGLSLLAATEAVCSLLGC
jgi:hypothetical protein